VAHRRFYGVVTALVLGPRADRYVFTSALPVEVLRHFAPQISSLYSAGAKPAGTETASAQRPTPDIQDASTARTSGL
jgi:hypothetical protein